MKAHYLFLSALFTVYISRDSKNGIQDDLVSQTYKLMHHLNLSLFLDAALADIFIQDISLKILLHKYYTSTD